ncbi:cytochrome c oxidase assembly factor 3, mitochondrial [Trichomonascus vanleenenianus]|uniref:Coa3p n=1 Tax=Trichomonascus vanleenenianus TaxID=2268995 RepID=UPI003ECA4802
MSQHRRPDWKKVDFLKPSPYQNPYTFTMTPAALRARKPFFWKNITVASALFGLSAGIYWYTLRTIQTDDFEDVPIPPISNEELARLKKEHEANKAAAAAAAAAAEQKKN